MYRKKELILMRDRLPALPLIVNDPYFSVWMPGDTFTSANTVHWAGAEKPLQATVTVDGKTCMCLGHNGTRAMETIDVQVTPTATTSVLRADNIEITLSFRAPALPNDLDALSAPITFVDYAIRSTDGAAHEVAFTFFASDALCYDGASAPAMRYDTYDREGLHMAYIGRLQQHVLGNSGDHITIDWGYLYLAAPNGEFTLHRNSIIKYRRSMTVGSDAVSDYLMLGYDDIAAVNYFGVPCRAWYQRHGQTLPGMMARMARHYDSLKAACRALDEQVQKDALAIGGEDYRLICAAAWRHTLGAHKLIATPEGEMALLSKENDSNGCIGTVDVSYPSAPLFLKYCPELVNALCRPVLAFAQYPVWEEDFAPHDVGRYPYATGQVYAAEKNLCGITPAPFYLYPAGKQVYNIRNQMPVEECGNMLIMLEAAMTMGAGEQLLYAYAPTLEKWVQYLDKYGEDPGDQLCTDDFAGHLAHNINLSAKAIVGVACYARMQRRLCHEEAAARWEARAKEMAASWLARAQAGDHTALTFDGEGWSMKYNLAWDKVLNLHLLPDDFYRRELASYLPRINRYGLPLDSRADYTKSDWILWTAAMAQDQDTFDALVAPVARYLRESTTRVAFSDWYDSKTGMFVQFIGRSVQGGLYMPMLTNR